MYEQLSLFNIELQPSPNDDLIFLIKKGSGFADGKSRILKYFSSEHTINEQIDFLKTEYGVGGGTFKNGFHGHNAKGIEISYRSHKKHYSWKEIVKIIDGLIKTNQYIVERLREKVK